MKQKAKVAAKVFDIKKSVSEMPKEKAEYVDSEMSRLNMRIEPLSNTDFSLVEIKTTNDCAPTPHCKIHGAMNKLENNIWRCISATGYRNITHGKSKGKEHVENFCKAGCRQI